MSIDSTSLQTGTNNPIIVLYALLLPVDLKELSPHYGFTLDRKTGIENELCLELSLLVSSCKAAEIE